MVMDRRFKPVISRIKLNPEQAVLTCDCYTSDLRGSWEPFVTNQAFPASTGAFFCNICIAGRNKYRTTFLLGHKSGTNPSNSSS